MFENLSNHFPQHQHRRAITSLTEAHPFFTMLLQKKRTPPGASSTCISTSTTSLPLSSNPALDLSSSSSSSTTTTSSSSPSSSRYKKTRQQSIIFNADCDDAKSFASQFSQQHAQSQSLSSFPHHFSSSYYHHHHYTFSSCSTTASLHSRLHRFLCVMKHARSTPPISIPLRFINGPLQISSFLVDSFHDVNQLCSSIAICDINTKSLSIIHGISSLLNARQRSQNSLDVHVLCTCGHCITKEDIQKHYALLVLAAQYHSNATIPQSFLNYVGSREGVHTRDIEIVLRKVTTGNGKERIMTDCNIVTPGIQRKCSVISSSKDINVDTEDHNSNGSGRWRYNNNNNNNNNNLNMINRKYGKNNNNIVKPPVYVHDRVTVVKMSEVRRKMASGQFDDDDNDDENSDMTEINDIGIEPRDVEFEPPPLSVQSTSNVESSSSSSSSFVNLNMVSNNHEEKENIQQQQQQQERLDRMRPPFEALVPKLSPLYYEMEEDNLGNMPFLRQVSEIAIDSSISTPSSSRYQNEQVLLKRRKVQSFLQRIDRTLSNNNNNSKQQQQVVVRGHGRNGISQGR